MLAKKIRISSDTQEIIFVAFHGWSRVLLLRIPPAYENHLNCLTRYY